MGSFSSRNGVSIYKTESLSCIFFLTISLLSRIISKINIYFLPSSIRSWNELSPETRDSNSVQSFRYQLNKKLSRPPKYYYIGDRFIQIQHTRLRTNCSILNHHLFSKNITDNPNCTCGAIETTKHFFLECQRYNNIRIVMLNALNSYCMPNINIILFGVADSDFHTNCQIFPAVHKFILDSKRFIT